MNDPYAYREIIQSHIDKIKTLGSPVIIFGMGRAGWHIMKVLQFFGIKITAFCSNSASASDNIQYHNYNVISPDEVLETYRDVVIFLGVFRYDNANIVKAQFERLGISQVFYDTAAFLFVYLVDVAGRQCDEEELARSISILFENYKEETDHYGYTKNGYFVSPYVTQNITQKCTLRCRDCSQLIPYYKKPINFPVEDIVSDLKKYASAFDVVPEISLQGGEPFLHPKIGDICKEAAKISNIVFINFTTNSTILPNNQVLRQLSESGADVHQSGNYGVLSTEYETLREALSNYNIYSDILFTNAKQMWVKSIPYIKHNRSAENLYAMYRNCVKTKTCCQIMNGELHRCALSMHGTNLGLFPKIEGDFVYLYEAISEAVFINKIRTFLTRKQALSVCDFCGSRGWVNQAIQFTTNEKPVLMEAEVDE